MRYRKVYIRRSVSVVYVVCPTEVDIALSLPQAQARESGHSSPTNHRRHTACSRARCANCRLAWHKRAWGSTWTADVGEPPPHTWTCCLGQSYRAYRSLYDSPATSRCRRVLQAQCAPPGVDELQLRRGESKEGSGRDGIVPLMLQSSEFRVITSQTTANRLS